ncbi:MAG: winged helix-turn-helix transcriptional regulator [Actinobacteria bacterium]|nr:winged helix-turn-helix transcriptional regulator [Actinomycetota bacterium]
MPVVSEPSWTFLTNHAHVLLAISAESQIRIRDIAAQVGITERAAHRIVSDLEVAGYLKVSKIGRRNEYSVIRNLPLRHPAERHHRIGELLKVLAHDSKR